MDRATTKPPARAGAPTTRIALLRGLGGKYTLPMKGLVELLEGLGLCNVRTYIQSGNAVFQSHGGGNAGLAEAISGAVEKRYGFAPRVIIRSPTDLEAAMTANPFPEAEPEPKSLHLFFLDQVPDHPDLDRLDRLRQANERYHLAGKTFYFHAPDGVGRSRAFAVIEKALGVTATARNWRTVCAVKALADRYG